MSGVTPNVGRELVRGAIITVCGRKSIDRVTEPYPDGSVEVYMKNVCLSFDDLLRISDLVGTKHIDIGFENGWGGTDVTPGDPPEFTLTFRWKT